MNPVAGRTNPDLTSTCPEIEAAFATEVVNTLSAEVPTLATVTVVTSVKYDQNKLLVLLYPCIDLIKYME